MAESEKGKADVKQTRHRSPNYPAIGLRKAVELVRQLEGKYRRSSVPINLAHILWGYKAHSGAGNQVVAALRSFGLVDVSGESTARQIRITDQAIHIVGNGPSSPQLLIEAALRPAIYGELWEKYKPELPDDEIVKHYLQWDRAEGTFNRDVVDDFIADFRDTLDFAKLIGSDIIDPAEGQGDRRSDERHQGERQRGQPTPPPAQQRRKKMPGTKEAILPLDTGGEVIITWPDSISEEDAADVEGWMEMMKKKLARAAKSRPEVNARPWADSLREVDESGDPS